MSTLKFTLELKKRIPPADWAWLLLSLRQDKCVWSALEETELGKQALDQFPAQADAWSPAALSLLTLENRQTLDELRSTPLVPLNKELQTLASQVYESWVKKPEEPMGLATAGLLALTFREQFRLSASWQEALLAVPVEISASRPMFACLYGMLPAPGGLLAALCGSGKPGWVSLAVHAILSNPTPPEVQQLIFGDLIAAVDLPIAITILHALNPLRPQMTALLAQQALSNPLAGKTRFAAEPGHRAGIEDLDPLIHTLRLVQMRQLAGQPDLAVPALSDSLRMIRQMRGDLSAQLATSIIQTNGSMAEGISDGARKASVDACKQSVQLAPDEPRYAAGYAKALMRDGRLQEAFVFLKSYLEEEKHPSHPELMLTYASILDQLDQQDAAQKAATDALRMTLEGTRISERDLASLILRLIRRDDLAQALEAVQVGLAAYPVSRELLALSAKIYALLGEPDQAIPSIYAAQAAAVCQPEGGGWSPTDPGLTWEASYSTDRAGIGGLLDLQRLLVESLEATSSWESAYHERLALLETQENPPVGDLKALVTDAVGANKHVEAIDICQKILRKNPADLWTQRQLAEAAEAIQDYETALEHFNLAVQIAPDQSDLWKGLVRVQTSAGQTNAAAETLRAASQALPQDGEIQFELGKLYLSQGSTTLALPFLRRAAASDPDGVRNDEVAIRLGEALTLLGRLDEARRVLLPVFSRFDENLRSVAASDDTPAAQFIPDLAHHFARSLVGIGEPEKAISILSQVVRLRPDQPEPCLDLAQALMQLGDQASGARQALPFLQRILGIGPDGIVGGYAPGMDGLLGLRGKARLYLADAYAAIGEWEKAMDAYRVAIEDPANRDTSIQTHLSVGLGLTALRLELPEMAVAALQDAAQSEPLSEKIQRSLCEAYLTNGLVQDAFLAAQTARDLSPSDIDSQAWFIEQGMRIAALPGAAVNQVHAEVIQTLRSALQLDPERADLLLQLGSLLMKTESRSEALEIFHKLAALDTDNQQISIEDLHRAGLMAFENGDAPLAADLLRKAIAHFELAAGDREATQKGVSLSDLYDALIKALLQNNDLESALEVIERALVVEKAHLAFHASKAEVLFRLGRFEDARESLEISLKQWPEHAGLQFRMARTLDSLGDPPAALHQVEQAIALIEDSTSVDELREYYQFAARLAQALLRPRRAFAYFQKAIPFDHPDYNQIENAILRAELALDAGEDQAAFEAAEVFDSTASETPLVLALSARVAHRGGDRDRADKKCRSAVRAWTRLQMGQPGVTPATNKEAFLSEISTVGLAAIENHQWADAISLFKQMVEMFPEAALAHFLLAQATMLGAEAQVVCEDLEVIQHAPGADALHKQAAQVFEDSLKMAAQLVGCAAILKQDGIPEDWDVEIKRSIGVCSRRGWAVFRATLENAAALEYILQTIIPEAADVAALMMAYRRCGANDRAIKSAQVGWRPVFDGQDYRSDPQVVVQLALAQSDVRKAIDLMLDEMARPSIGLSSWPDLPMRQFLVAKLCLQVEDLPIARQAILQALEQWPDEPRWQALAATIQRKQPGSNQLKQLAEAISYLEKAAALEPNYSQHQLALGEIYLESGQIARAIPALESATRLEPQNAAGWIALAKAQQMTGDMDQAALSADQAVEYSEEPTEALLLRAEIALQTSNHRGALSRAQTVLRAQPEHPQALYLLARALEGVNRLDEALAALEQALPKFQHPPAMQIERLNLIKRSQGLEAGLRALQELVALNPKKAPFLALLAEWLQEAGKMDAAVQAARLALQDGQDGLMLEQRADLNTMIGLHMRTTGQLDQAIRYLSEAIACSSDHLEAYLELGRVYQDRREYQQALKVYQKAINLSGGDYRPYYQAGMVLKENKDYMAAEAMLRRAAQLAPNEVAVHRLLGAIVALNLVHSHRLVPSEGKGNEPH